MDVPSANIPFVILDPPHTCWIALHVPAIHIKIFSAAWHVWIP
jgi:hypothetical protein